MIPDELMKKLIEVRDSSDEVEEVQPTKESKVEERDEQTHAAVLQHVKKVLSKDYHGERLDNAADSVTHAILKMDPDILEDDEFGPRARANWREFVWDMAGRLGETKVNEQDDEDEGVPPEEPEAPKEPKPKREPKPRKEEEEPAEPETDEEEVPEITKEYLGNTEDVHYYLISNEDEAGEVEDLQIVDQEGVEKFSAVANSIPAENVPEFLFKGIKELQIESIEFGIFDRYLYPYVFEEEEEEDLGDEDMEGLEDLEEPLESKKEDKDTNESKKHLIEMRIVDHENNAFDVRLVDDGSMDTVIDINGKEIRFESEFASYWRDESGDLSEEGLKELALDALANMDEEEYHELVARAASSQGIETESKTDEDVRELTPGRYEVVYHDGHKETVSADSPHAAKRKGENYYSDSPVSTVNLLQPTGPRQDVHFRRESKTDEGAGDLVGHTKEVFEVEFEKDGKKDKTRVTDFSEAEAKKNMEKKPGVKVLSVKKITSAGESKGDDLTKSLLDLLS